ncbi:MAG: HAD family hydrolase [Clostridia bacterium]|nr:HAD family hydrolase [Clostridia bacterium]
MSVYVFDLGGTLMEYIGMPASWIEYYPEAFRHISEKLCPNCSESDLQRSVDLLTTFNPRISKREIEYTPEYIFSTCLSHWPSVISIPDAIHAFFEGIHLSPFIYPDTLPALKHLKAQGHFIATLTDLPTAMPDSLFRRDISELLPYFDLYMSSASCGFRKPNPAGLQQIATHFSIDVRSLIFVGDEDKDAQTAINAGCSFLRIDRKKVNSPALRTLIELAEKPLFK